MADASQAATALLTEHLQYTPLVRALVQEIGRALLTGRSR
jgi:hypothetical protein